MADNWRGRIDRVLTTALMKDVPNPLVAEDSIRVVNILEGQRTAGVLSHVANDVEDGALIHVILSRLVRCISR
eukprot:SAG31_NODE_4565_length_3132_cov_2.438510_3_plen_73_part_00